MDPEDWLMLITWGAAPIYLAVRFRWLGFSIGMLVLWIVQGVSIELGWLSCRPGWEPLRDPVMFVIGFLLFSWMWFGIYALKEGIMRGMRRRSGQQPHRPPNQASGGNR